MADKNKRTKHHAQWIKESHRFMGDWVARILVKTSITPTQITIFRLFCGLMGAVLIALNHEYWTLIVSAVLIYLFTMLDAADGSLAKIKKTGTLLGAWIDRQSDGLGFYCIFIAIGVRFIQSDGNTYWPLLPMVTFSLAYILKAMRISIMLKYRPIFEKVDINKSLKEPLLHKPNNTSSKRKFLLRLKQQVDHDFATISFIIILGLVSNQLKFMSSMLFVYLFLWWFFKTLQNANRARKHDRFPS